MVDRIGIAAIMKAELPGHTAYLVDGGTITVDGDTYLSSDSVLGVPASFESLNEGVGDEAPAAAITFLVPSDVAASTLNSPLLQGSRIRIWTEEFDEDDGTPIGDPVSVADLIVDRPRLDFENNARTLTFECTSNAERLFMLNTGNVLSPAFHEGIWPGEKGLSNASGVGASVAWGTASQGRGTTGGSGGFADSVFGERFSER